LKKKIALEDFLEKKYKKIHPVVEKTKEIPNQIKKSADWLSFQSESFDFAEISIKIIIYNGTIKQIEKTTKEKVRGKKFLKKWIAK
jgi:hypothetical protein